MVHREVIGRVVGENGYTYIPTSITTTDGNKIVITFTNQKTGAEEALTGMSIPYYVPIVDNDRIRFVLNSEETQPGEILLSSLKGEKGETGAMQVRFIDKESFTQEQIDELYENMLYVDYNAANNDNDNNTYVVRNVDGHNKLEPIGQIINLDDYYTKNIIDSKEADIYQTIETSINGVIAQQQAISMTLMDGINIPDEQPTSSNNTVNVMSDESVESLKNEILTLLQNYAQIEDIDFTVSDNAIYLTIPTIEE